MLAELDQVTGRRARGRFALGAARAALVPPGSPRLAAILLAGAAAAAAIAIHVMSPVTLVHRPRVGGWIRSDLKEVYVCAECAAHKVALAERAARNPGEFDGRLSGGDEAGPW